MHVKGSQDRGTVCQWTGRPLSGGFVPPRSSDTAQLMLARYLASGAAGERNLEEAQLWLERAIAQGIPDAESDLAALTQTTQHVPT
jgi:TPR repeat protein